MLVKVLSYTLQIQCIFKNSHTVRCTEMYNYFFYAENKFRYLCAVISGIIILCALLLVGGSVTVKEAYKCTDISSVSQVYLDDTVFAARLTNCQGKALLQPVSTPRGAIDVYATSCDNATVHSESLSYTSPEYSDVDNPVTVIDQFNKTGHNYYVTNTIAEITTNMSSHNSTEVYMCLFSNSSDYRTFMNVDERFFNVMKLAVRCDKLQVEGSLPHKMPFTINTTGYYFVGIVALQILDTLQFNVSVERKFYDRSDFIHDRLNCHLAHVTSNCSVENAYRDTCIMLHATPIDINDFSYINVGAPRTPLHRSPGFIVAISTVPSCIILVLCVTALILFVKYKKKCM